MPTILTAAYTIYRRDPRVKREAEALLEVGYNVVAFCLRQRGEPVRETIGGVEVIHALGTGHRRTSRHGYIVDYLLFFAKLSLHLLRHPRRYQLIHVSNMPDFLVLAAWLPKLLGVPVIHDVHDLMPELYSEKFEADKNHWMVRLLEAQEVIACRFASQVLTVEERLKEILSSRGVPAEKIHVLMNLPDERIFRRSRSPRPNPRTGSFVLAYHGTLARRLGLDIAIRAVALIKPAVPELSFLVIGAGEERENLIRLRDELALQSAVVFSEGFVAVERIPELIADAHVGIVPLRRTAGTDIMLPTKLLEYVQLGIPCIVPRTPAISRYFADDMVQFFEAENVASLATAIELLYRDPHRRELLAAAARTRFGDHYTWTKHKEVYTSLVDDLVSRRKRIESRSAGN